jgi:FdhD protein
MPAADQPIRYYRYSKTGKWESLAARVITETAVSLTVNGETWLSFNCTPTGLDALAVGFLFNEGLIEAREEIAIVDVCQQETNVDIWLHHPIAQPTRWRRTSGCTGGVTSVPDIEPGEVLATLPVSAGPLLDPDLLLGCMEQLLQIQELYRAVRGVHCSALSDGRQILAHAEDIGRHNTLDKLAGQVLLEDLRADPVVILTTGRVSSEMLQKSARLGASAVVSRTSPTSQSIALADPLGITLAGYARRNQMLVYTHTERLQ